MKTVRLETIRWQAALSLGRVDPDNQTAIAALVQIIETTKNESTQRKAAYSLGKIDGGNAIAISTLTKMAESATDVSQRRQATENLKTLRGDEIEIKRQQNSKLKIHNSKCPPNTLLSSILQSLASASDDHTKRRKAEKLAKLDPGNPVAFTTLLQLIKSTQSQSFSKRTSDNLKETLLDEQFPQVIASLKDCFSDEVSEDEMEQFRECYKLIWHCAENMTYLEFYRVWHHDTE